MIDRAKKHFFQDTTFVLLLLSFFWIGCFDEEKKSGKKQISVPVQNSLGGIMEGLNQNLKTVYPFHDIIHKVALYEPDSALLVFNFRFNYDFFEPNMCRMFFRCVNIQATGYIQEIHPSRVIVNFITEDSVVKDNVIIFDDWKAINAIMSDSSIDPQKYIDCAATLFDKLDSFKGLMIAQMLEGYRDKTINLANVIYKFCSKNEKDRKMGEHFLKFIYAYFLKAEYVGKPRYTEAAREISDLFRRVLDDYGIQDKDPGKTFEWNW